MWGQFTMDMTVATVQSPDGISVPTLGTSTVGASLNLTSLGVQSHDYASAFHAVTMCLAIGLIMPLDVVIFKLFRKVRVHIFFQVLVMLLFLAGLGLGFYVSVLFVRVSFELLCTRESQAHELYNRARTSTAHTKSSDSS